MAPLIYCLCHLAPTPLGPQVPIPPHVDLYHLDGEAEPSDRTALEAVIDHLRNEMKKLEEMEAEIMEEVRTISGQRG